MLFHHINPFFFVITENSVDSRDSFAFLEGKKLTAVIYSCGGLKEVVLLKVIEV